MSIFDFFHIKLISNKFVFLDVYSIFHLVLGFLVILALLKYKDINLSFIFLILFFILIGWEFIEYNFDNLFPNIIERGTKLNTMWDIIIGMAGGFTGYIMNKKFS